MMNMEETRGSTSPVQQYGWKLPPGETFRVLIVGERTSCHALLGALLRREDLLQMASAGGRLEDGEQLPTSRDRHRVLVEETIQSHGQVLQFILEDGFLSSSAGDGNKDDEAAATTASDSDDDNAVDGGGAEPHQDSAQAADEGLFSSYLSPMRRLMMNGAAASPPSRAAPMAATAAAAVNEAELEETVRRRRKNDAILQFVRDKAERLDAVWFCFSHQNWTDGNARKEARFIIHSPMWSYRGVLIAAAV
jgi:hypothetical protein